MTLIQGGFFNWCVLNVWRSENDTNKSFDDLKGIQIWSTDFDNPEVYSDTSIFDDLVFLVFWTPSLFPCKSLRLTGVA